MVTFTTEITSNTALISIMLPILFKVAEQTGIDATLIMMVATICASDAFILPIAIPPNAIARKSKYHDQTTRNYQKYIGEGIGARISECRYWAFRFFDHYRQSSPTRHCSGNSTQDQSR